MHSLTPFGLVCALLLSGTDDERLSGSVTKLRNNLRVEQILEETFVVTDTDYFWSNTLVA